MTQYDDTNRGVLFRETNKKSDKAPDYKGKLNVNGEEFELAGWIRESKKGTKFLSVSVSEPWQKDEQRPPRRANDNQRSQQFQSPARDMPERMSPNEIPRGGLPDDFDDVPFSNYELRGYWV